jgi:drug/metabolite transporter (DMT)-like permease
MQQAKFKGLLFAILGSILWGCSGTAAQIIFQNTNIKPFWLVGVRLVSAGILLIISSSIISGPQTFTILRDKRNIWGLILFAALGMVPSQLTYFLAIHYGNAATATILQFMGPLFIIIFLAFENQERPRRIDLISIVIAIIGTLLLVTKGHLNGLSLSPLAIFWGIMAGVAQAGYTLTPRRLLRHFDASIVTGWAMLFGSIPFLGAIVNERPSTIAPQTILLIIFIIIGGTMFSYLFYISSLKYLKADTTGMLSSFEPLTAAFLAIFLLGLHVGFAEIIGSILILSTAFLQALPNKISE